MKYQFVDQHRSSFEVEKMCRLLKVSRSGYYAWQRRPKSKREISNDQLDKEIKEIYESSRQTYGSPRITKELKKRKKIHCSKNRVAARMRKNGIKAKTKRRFKTTTHSKHNHPVAPNHVNQDFKVYKPNQVWVSDITYLWTREGWLYLVVIIDLFSRKVVGWSMNHTLGCELVLNAFQQAFWRNKPPKGLIFHSDRGVQYACKEFRKVIKRYKLIQSMSGAGNCYDNAVSESFFHTLKTELVYFESYQTRTEAKSSVFEYIEMFYNRIRLHSSLNYCSPEEFERCWFENDVA